MKLGNIAEYTHTSISQAVMCVIALFSLLAVLVAQFKILSYSLCISNTRCKMLYDSHDWEQMVHREQ